MEAVFTYLAEHFDLPILAWIAAHLRTVQDRAGYGEDKRAIRNNAGEGVFMPCAARGGRMSHPDTNEILRDTAQYKPSRYDDYDFPQPILDLHEPVAHETASWLEYENNSLKSKIAYLEGKIEAYENYLKKMGIIADTEEAE